jgi:hypothetical protein
MEGVCTHVLTHPAFGIGASKGRFGWVETTPNPVGDLMACGASFFARSEISFRTTQETASKMKKSH